MNNSAVAVHGVLLLSAVLSGLLAARRGAPVPVWPLVGLLALLFASAAPAASPARAILGIAIALPSALAAGGGSPLTSAAAAGAFVSLAAATALGVERYAAYTLYAVAGGLLVLATVAWDGRRRPAATRWILASAALAVAAPLLDFAGRWASLAPWATLPHAVALAGLASLRRDPPRADGALAARLDRLERELGFARRAGAVALVTAAAVHELKGLLADLGLASEFAASTADPAARERALGVMIATADQARRRALSLLDDMQRTEREAPASCALRELLEEASAAAATSPGAARIAVEAPPDLACVTRRSEVRLAVVALARNALAASARGGSPPPVLRASASGLEVQVELSDEAGGLPLEVRLDGLEAPLEPREGLGLVLAARLVEQNGGRLDYLSSEGRSCFRVSLPVGVDSAGDRLL